MESERSLLKLLNSKEFLCDTLKVDQTIMQNYIVHQMSGILKIVRGQIDSFELLIKHKILNVDSL